MRFLYIDVDSLRADRVGANGYSRRITPHLDRLIPESLVMESCYCSDSPCLPSRTAWTAVQHGLVNGVVGHFGRDVDFGQKLGHRFFGEQLFRNGIYTASISCFADRHRADYFKGNFRECIRPTLSSGNNEDARDIHVAAVEWLDRKGREDNWFLHLNYWDPHIHYTIDQEWADQAAASGPPPDWPDEYTIRLHHERYFGPLTASDRLAGLMPSVPTMPEDIRSRKDFEQLVNGYDGCILYWDHWFGKLVEHLKSLGIYDETVIIVSADHGESFGENGSYAEHNLANPPTHHIPLIIRWPGVTDCLPEEKRRSNQLVYHFDFAPTLCEMLDIPIPKNWHGQSFAPLLRGETAKARDHLVLSHGAHTYQRAVCSHDYWYMRTLHPGSFYTEKEALFHLRDDPRCTRNLIEECPEVADWHKARLFDWWHHYAGFPNARPDPMHASLGQGPVCYSDPWQYVDKLRQAGREENARHLEESLRPPWG